MRFSAFAVLLVIAGACATPLSEVEVSQGRIYDLVVEGKIQQGIDWLRKRDPWHVKKRDFNIVIISRLAEAIGTIRNLKISGASRIEIENLSYNFGLGRLDFDVVHRGLHIALEHADVKLIYGDYRGEGVASGSLEIRDIRLKGNVLLKHDSTGRPWIYNVNAELGVASIEADLKVVGSHRDYSEQVNNFCNVRVPEMFHTYRNEINTIVGELIRRGVELIRD